MSAPPDLMIAQAFMQELNERHDSFDTDHGADPAVVREALYLVSAIVTGGWVDTDISIHETNNPHDFFRTFDCAPLLAPYTVQGAHTPSHLEQIKATWLMTRRMDGKPVEHLSLPHWEHL